MSKYYEISISDGKINHTTITIEDKENKEVVKIYGTLKENGYIEEMVSWINLKQTSKVPVIRDRRVIDYVDDNIVVTEILPKGEYFNYHLEPCCNIVKEVNIKEIINELNKLRSTPNGQKLYRSIVEELINKSVKNYHHIETLEPLYDDSKEEHIPIADELEEGFYKLTLSDTNRLYKYIQITDDIKLPILGIYKDGIMTFDGLDIVLKDVKDTSIININSNNYYYSKECFIKANKISNNSVIKCLSLLKDNREYANNYFTEVQSIIYNSTHNTKKEEVSIKSKKVRAINPYKNNPKVKNLNQKPLSRKKKKELKKASNS